MTTTVVRIAQTLDRNEHPAANGRRHLLAEIRDGEGTAVCGTRTASPIPHLDDEPELALFLVNCRKCRTIMAAA